jgi:hypothetical protein
MSTNEDQCTDEDQEMALPRAHAHVEPAQTSKGPAVSVSATAPNTVKPPAKFEVHIHTMT